MDIAQWVRRGLRPFHWQQLVVLLISLSTGTVLATAEHRIFATVLGGAVALVVASVFPRTQATAIDHH